MKIRKQRVVTTENRGNQWTTGREQKFRHPENFCFKFTPEYYEKAAALIAEHGITKQQLCDDMAALYFDESISNPIEIVLQPLVIAAINDSIFNKSAAIRAENKKKSPDLNAIASWESEIQELQSYL
ncbi:MAG: hypothetical protein ABI417_11080 [Coleofasciculaceae cyanobacterium]